MLYNFNGTLLNVADIVTVSTSKGQRAEYPFVLTVAMRNGQQFAVSYHNEIDRIREVNEIARALTALWSTPLPATRLSPSWRSTLRKSEPTFNP